MRNKSEIDTTRAIFTTLAIVVAEHNGGEATDEAIKYVATVSHLVSGHNNRRCNVTAYVYREIEYHMCKYSTGE